MPMLSLYDFVATFQGYETEDGAKEAVREMNDSELEGHKLRV